MSITTSATQARRAPGQHGGKPWKGPRERLTLRVPLHVAAILRMQAEAEGVSLSDQAAVVLAAAYKDV